ncbi:HAD family hydrolase [Nocardiopsis ansamitocini]|uniref:Hydrolase of the HAD superfamily n=1 Tax=Nocardiopsis ansamitocini TaxID=1670832 RepID=A0A9W6UJF9_9ACTN|nr:HAD family hydrolase [Nocardiopsis ansamitocini]GLU48468.1 hypothetical protein Nans01_28190 [Nocardiopsis ansamitocini]
MPEHTGAPTAILFDLDDTLIDDHAASSNGLRALMHHLGHPDFTSARQLWDVQTDLSFNAYLAGRLTLTQQRHERIRALATHAGHTTLSDHHCDDLYQHYLTAHRNAWRAFDDTDTTLTQLAQRGITLGVVTNGTHAFQHDKLTALNLAHHFSAVVCSDTAGAGKPDPRIFHAACTQLNTPPDQTWHVGDQLRADALGALTAGLRPVLCDRQSRNPHTDIPTITDLNGLIPLVADAAAAAVGLL